MVLFIVTLMTAMISIACIFSGLTVGGKKNLELTVTLREDIINRLLRHSFTEQDEDNLLKNITSVDMQADLIRIFGTYTHAEGSEVPGSADLTFSAKDGKLHAEIIAVDINGLDVNHPRVSRINDVLEREIGEAASDSDEVEFVSIEITEDSLELIIKVTPSK
jgi:hypothetical protein